jgi:hypothetical protein
MTLNNFIQSALNNFMHDVLNNIKENTTCYIESGTVNQNHLKILAYRSDISIKIDCYVHLTPKGASVHFFVDCPITGTKEHQWESSTDELNSENLAANIGCYL